MKRKLSSLFAIALALTMATAVVAQVTYSNPVFTSYQIANLGSSAANITVTYYDANGVTTSSQNRTFNNVPVGGSVTVQQSIESTLGSGTWSAVVSSDQPIAAVVNQQLGTSGSGSSIVPYSSYSGASSGALTVTLPAIMHNWFGYYTDVYIQNVGSGDANVTVSYAPTALGACTTGAAGQTDSTTGLKQYASKLISQVSKTTLGAPAATGCAAFQGRFLGAATVTSNQPIVVVVNEQVQGKLFTYNGFTDSNAGTTLLAPAYLKNFFGFYAALTIANPSASSTANITVTYTSDASFSNPTNKTVVANHTIAPGKSVTRYDGPGTSTSDLNTDFGGAGQKFFGSVKIQSDIPVVAVVNQESTSAAGNKGGTYNVFASSEAGTKLSAPLIQSDFYGFYTSLSVQSVDGTNPTVRITYTSDGTFSSNKNATQTYTHTLASGFLNRFEGPTASAAQSDLLDDAFWLSGGTRRFIGSATIEVVSGSKVVAFVNSEAGGQTNDAQYTYNAFVVTP